MHVSTIRQLNKLNQQFYQTIAPSFSATRQHFWPGWEQVWKNVQTLFQQSDPALVLDVGCGNGRFAKFLDSKTNHFSYFGVDQNDQLLAIADSELANLSAPITLQELDLIEHVLAKAPLFPTKTNYDLIVVLGVLHHIPSYQLRKDFLLQLQNLLSDKGTLVLSCWQFQHNQNLFSRRVEPESLEINHHHLEPNDYLLTWERQNPAVRYCHLVDRVEQDKLIADLQLSLLDRFSADGLSNASNEYLILKKD